MPKKIKIALFIRGFHNGGIEKVFENYYAHMDLDPYEIHVITHMKNIQEKKEIFENMGCIIHELSPLRGSRITPKNISEYFRLFRENEFDIVHNNMPDNLLPFFFAKVRGAPVRILHAHGNYTDGIEKRNPFTKTLIMKGFAINTKNATQLVAVSRISGLSAFGAEPDKEVVILPTAMSIKKFSFDQKAREIYRQKLGIENQLVIGHIGRYDNSVKNQEFVLDVFRMLLEKKSNCCLLMIGDGRKLAEFRKMAADMGIADKVIFTGNVQNVQDYLQAMDVFVLPSRKEGLGIVAVEAQASGLYCLVSEKVPREAKVSDLVKFLPIENGTKMWVEAIENRPSVERSIFTNVVKKSGYDIDQNVGKLYELYSRGKVNSDSQ